jgi:hypothetical protein
MPPGTLHPAIRWAAITDLYGIFIAKNHFGEILFKALHLHKYRSRLWTRLLLLGYIAASTIKMRFLK